MEQAGWRFWWLHTYAPSDTQTSPISKDKFFFVDEKLLLFVCLVEHVNKQKKGGVSKVFYSVKTGVVSWDDDSRLEMDWSTMSIKLFKPSK